MAFKRNDKKNCHALRAGTLSYFSNISESSISGDLLVICFKTRFTSGPHIVCISHGVFRVFHDMSARFHALAF